MRPSRITTAVVALLLALPPGTAHAALRSPQVPVTGSALQLFFTSQGQSINVSAGQQDIQTLVLPDDASFEVHPFGSITASFGGYNAGGPPAPDLYLIVPGAATTGWFADVAFRAAPARLVVDIFDPNSILQGTSSYLGADNTSFAFYVQDLGGTFFLQDARNPGGAPHVLAFSGTGARAGSTWFACETSSGPGGDFADAVVLVTLPFAPVPAAHASWSRVKALYH